jgi:hypothetical protein
MAAHNKAVGSGLVLFFVIGRQRSKRMGPILADCVHRKHSGFFEAGNENGRPRGTCRLPGAAAPQALDENGNPVR